MIVYLITNKINGKRYIGQTIQTLNKRWYNHCHVGKSNKGMPVVNAIKKYEKENFEIKILSKCKTVEEMNHREAYYIKLLNTRYPSGYNVLSGGSNSLHTEESKKKIADAQTGSKNHNFGKKASKETKEKQSKGRLGVKRSKEICKACSERVSGDKHPMFGKHHREESKKKMSHKMMGRAPGNKGKKASQETRDKISLAGMGRVPSVETKNKLSEKNSKPDMEIFCHQTQTKYRSINYACKILKLIRHRVKGVLKGKSRHTKGYTFEYTNKENCPKRKFRVKVPIFCHQTNETYGSVLEAIKRLKIHAPGIYSSLRTGKSTKGYTFEYANKEGIKNA